jgi:hypothetical protein
VWRHTWRKNWVNCAVLTGNIPGLRTGLGPTQPPVQRVPGRSRGVKSGLGLTLSPNPLLVPLSWKVRAIPLLPLLAVRPVQSLSACTGVHFTFFIPWLKLVIIWCWLYPSLLVVLLCGWVVLLLLWFPYLIISNFLLYLWCSYVVDLVMRWLGLS